MNSMDGFGVLTAQGACGYHRYAGNPSDVERNLTMEGPNIQGNVPYD